MKYRKFEFSLKYGRTQKKDVEEGIVKMSRCEIAHPPFFFDLGPEEEVQTSLGRKLTRTGTVEVPEGVSFYSFSYAFGGLSRAGEELEKTSHLLPLEMFPYDGGEVWE
jgi:hypothetical protein